MIPNIELYSKLTPVNRFDIVRRDCLVVSDPPKLLFINKECQNLRPPTSSPTVTEA